jgi:hypothetical protein
VSFLNYRFNAFSSSISFVCDARIACGGFSFSNAKVS